MIWDLARVFGFGTRLRKSEKLKKQANLACTFALIANSNETVGIKRLKNAAARQQFLGVGLSLGRKTKSRLSYLTMFNPLKNLAMSWSEDCHGRPRALTTVLPSTISLLLLKSGTKNASHNVNISYLLVISYEVNVLLKVIEPVNTHVHVHGGYFVKVMIV